MGEPPGSPIFVSTFVFTARKVLSWKSREHAFHSR